MSNKRPRGRPAGSGGINDEPILERMADRIVRDPRLKHTTVYKELDGEWTQTSIRRIQVKWKALKARHLAAAEARRAARLAERRSRYVAAVDDLRAARLPSNLRAYPDSVRNLIEKTLRTQQDIADLVSGGSVGRLTRDVNAMTQAARALDATSFTRAVKAMDGPVHVARQLREFQENIDRMLGVYRFGIR